MRTSRTSKMLSLAALATIACPFAAAQGPGWYIGANVGRSRARVEDAKVISGLYGGGLTENSISNDDHDTGFKIFGGYQFNPYFSLESGYFDLGKLHYTSVTLPDGVLSGHSRIRGLNLDAVGFLPFTEKFSAFGRIGVNYAEVKDKFSGTGLIYVPDSTPSKRDLNYKFGAGVQYDFTPTFAMRAEAERYRVKDAVLKKGNVDLISVGVVYRFGRTQAPSPRAASTEPIAPAAEPAVMDTPVLVVVPVRTQTQQYCTILDIQFEINEKGIQREEKEKLAVIGTFLTKYPETTAEIEGHTDNVGTAQYNMELSQQRADSVVSYLVDTLHIDPARLTAVGYGDTRPLADNDTELGKRKNRRIDAVVACVTDVAGLTVMPARITMALLIEFDQNKADVKQQYDDEIRKVADLLKANPSATATVEGHTGNLQATPELGMKISQQRAQNVVNYLVDNFGIARSRLSAQGFGRTRRFAYNTSLEGQQENRRVNIIINYAN